MLHRESVHVPGNVPVMMSGSVMLFAVRNSEILRTVVELFYIEYSKLGDVPVPRKKGWSETKLRPDSVTS